MSLECEKCKNIIPDRLIISEASRIHGMRNKGKCSERKRLMNKENIKKRWEKHLSSFKEDKKTHYNFEDLKKLANEKGTRYSGSKDFIASLKIKD